MGLTMNLNQYQSLAQNTRNKNLDTRHSLACAALGLSGESGEVADIIKKYLYHGHALDKTKLKSELGDILWYIHLMADTLGLTLEEIQKYNIDKLRQRYPEGFDSDKSINRST